MSRRGDVYLRRSSRTSQAIYKSLDENRLTQPLLEHILKEAERYKQRERRERADRERDHELSGKRYSFRSRTVYDDSYYDDELFTPVRQRSTKRRKIEPEEEIEASGDDAHVDEEDSTNRRSTRLRTRNSEPQLETLAKEPVTPITKRLSGAENKSSEKENGGHSLRTRRIMARRSNSVPLQPENEKKEPDVSESEDSAEEEGSEPRQYGLRQNRAPVDRFTAHDYSDRPRRKVAMASYQNSARSSLRRLPRERRKRRYSSSTASSDEEIALAKRDAKDEAAFQRRQLRSMRMNRQRLGPVNLTEKDISSSKHLFKERLRQLGGTSCTDIDPMGIDKDVRFDQVGGLTAHLQSLKETVLFPLLYPELFESFRITPPKGLLFYGPPGTGKTLVARALANECSQGDKKVAFFMRKGADVLSKWVGESERQLRLLFDQAYSMRPSIIFFDEIDGLAPVRSSRQDQIHSSIVSTLLALMDGLDSRGEVVVIGATNRLDSIDPALRRPGRFDRELAFTLPDKTARQSILNIHTKAWREETKPKDELMEWLAESTAGYCGADLKALCTESVLMAIRTKFPHIYLASEKLEVDPKNIIVSKEHFQAAMRNIVPACRRDVSIVSKQVNPRLAVLITPFVDRLFSEMIPSGYAKPNNLDNLFNTDLEKVVRAFEVPPSVPAARLLLHGHGNQGQTHYFLPVVANRLDHLSMHSISCMNVFSAVNPEEAINQMLQSAIRSSSKGIATVLLLPDLDVLQDSLSPASWNMLSARLESFIGFTTLLMIATVRQPLNKCSDDIRNLFGKVNSIEINPPAKEQREIYFRQLIEKALVEPFRFNPENYPELPKASMKSSIRKLNSQELKTLEDTYAAALRHFRIFLREMLGRLIRDRRFNIFNLPVDKEDAEDYYEIIANPLCLTDMMTKINKQQYSSKAEFLADIQLIRDNAIEYNPDKDLHGRVIRNAAFGLMDMAETLFEEELDDGFAEKLEEMKKLIDEAKHGEKPAQQLQRRTRQSVLHGFTDNGLVEADTERPIEESADAQHDPVKEVRKTPKSALKKKKKFFKKAETSTETSTEPVEQPSITEVNEASNDTPSVKSDVLPEVVEDIPMEILTEDQPTAVTEVFVIDQTAIESVVEKAVGKSNSWSVPQLESLGAAISQVIDRYSAEFNRESLPEELSLLISGFEP
ncbi:hypothetical protein FO519_004773 [Halicephalobus sp. NKZ332]|nr:hypothetical protein FO519_004773 [Halicephalobus sp. NKZ332]